MSKALTATTGKPRRTVNRLPPEQRIADIMRAARAVFTEYGYSDAPMSEIADRAGVVEGSIYRFFSSKRDLLVRVVEDWYEQMLREDSAQALAVSGVSNQITFIVGQHLASIRREPGLSRLVFQELRTDPEYRATRLFQLNQAYTHRLVDVVRIAQERHEFRHDISPTLIRDMVFGCVEHRTWAFLRGEGDFDAQALARDITELVCRAGSLDTPGESRQGNLDATRLDEVTRRLEAAVSRLETHSQNRAG